MKVIDWLSNNYQWLFSGVGVVLLVSLLSVLRKKLIPKKVKKGKSHLLEVSPSEIIQK